MASPVVVVFSALPVPGVSTRRHVNRKPRRYIALLLASVLLACSAAVLVAFVSPKVGVGQGNSLRGSPTGQRAATRTQDGIDEEAQDDGRVLDTNTFAGGIGGIVVSLAILPYIPIALYSSYLVATTGQGVPPGPFGIFGLAEGLSTLVVAGVSLWSFLSMITRGRGLPQGLFSFLPLVQTLSFLSSVLLLGATLIGGAEDNPLRGLILDSQFSAYATSTLETVSSGMMKASGGLAEGISQNAAPFTKELQAEFGNMAANIPVPDIDVDRLKPAIQVPDSMASFQAPEFKMPQPEFKMPQIPEFKMPENIMGALPSFNDAVEDATKVGLEDATKGPPGNSQYDATYG